LPYHKSTYYINKKYWVLPLVLWISIGFGYGQQAIQFSQYFSNQLVLNPAYAGADDALSLTFVHRNQWSGVKDSPRTVALSGHTLFKNEHTGLGINMILDKINIHTNSSITGIYSYRIKTSANSYLSFGLQAALNHIKSDYSSLAGSLQNPNDPNIATGNVSESAIQFGTGLYYKNPRLEVGISAPVIYSSGIEGLSDSHTLLSDTPHYFLFSSYKIDLSHRIQLQPGFLLKGKPGWPLSLDINISTLINKVLMFGLSYRSSETLSTIVQVKVLPQMKFGYSYDIPLSSVRRRNFNAHEIVLNYIFQYKDYNIQSPR
jgi:type IX secretion system PorP/SprF family membrane protein